MVGYQGKLESAATIKQTYQQRRSDLTPILRHRNEHRHKRTQNPIAQAQSIHLGEYFRFETNKQKKNDSRALAILRQ